MKKITALAGYYFALLSTCALGGDDLHGRVGLHGSIMKDACSIDMSSLNQTIDLGTLTSGELNRENYQHIVPFNIRLLKCDFSRVTQSRSTSGFFEIVFDGEHLGDWFINNGSAKGVGIVIYDGMLNRIIPGATSRPHIEQHNKTIIPYYLAVEKKGEYISSGDIFSSIRYKVNYF